MKNLQSGIKDMQRKTDLTGTEAQQIQTQLDKIKTQLEQLKSEKDLLMIKKNAADMLLQNPA